MPKYHIIRRPETPAKVLEKVVPGEDPAHPFREFVNYGVVVTNHPESARLFSRENRNRITWVVDDDGKEYGIVGGWERGAD